MLTKEENDLLCRVEGDAPMGQIMRRHWLPACLIEEVPEPDGDPLKIRLLGEDLTRDVARVGDPLQFRIGFLPRPPAALSRAPASIVDPWSWRARAANEAATL